MLRLSVITPSLNRAGVLAKTLGSVSRQDYPEIEHIAVDGGSSDGSAGILRGWRQPGFSWVSEPDAGPADAANKGLRRASGDIVALLGAGDVFLPGALSAVVRHFEGNPGCAVVHGRVGLLDGGNSIRRELPTGPLNHDRLLRTPLCRPPAVFWRRGLMTSFGVFDERLRFAYVREHLLRIGRSAVFGYEGGLILAGIGHDENDDSPGAVSRREEILDVVCRYAGTMEPVHDQLRELVRCRAAADRSPLMPGEGFGRRRRRDCARWLLLYAERHQILLDESILSEFDPAA